MDEEITPEAISDLSDEKIKSIGTANSKSCTCFLTNAVRSGD